ncbi:hypothetical protein Dimus_010335 [Dionaea muscipula]
MAYVISVKDHELPYGDWMTMIFNAFDVPLVDKKGEEPKRYDYFEDTFLTMCKLKRENGVWWIGTGEKRRKDDEMDAPTEEEEKKEVARSRVRGVEIKLDSMKLASILNVPGHTGISEYIKEAWWESKYIKPLEITRKFANNRLINVGESGSDDQFFDIQVDVEEPVAEVQLFQHFQLHQGIQQISRGSRHQQESTPRVHLVTFQNLL